MSENNDMIVLAPDPQAVDLSPDPPETGSTCPVCSGKVTHRTEDAKKKLINRLNRIEGQIRGIRGMIERDAYCNDILTQSAAVNAAMNAFNRDLIARHLRTCVKRDLLAGDDAVVDELVQTLQKLMK